MIQWYNNLYTGESLRKKKKRVIWKINHGAGMVGIYIITLAANPNNNLEIMDSSMLLQPDLRRREHLIIGIASGYYEALDMVREIAEEVYQVTGQVQIRSYLLEQQKKRK